MEREENAEAFYIRILLGATAVMLAFVFVVFAIGMRKTPEPDIPASGSEVFDSFETTAPEVVKKNYIPADSPSAAVFNSSRLDAEYAILVDASDMTAVGLYHADRRIFPASMTKVMTLLIACENIHDMNATVEVEYDVVAAAYVAGASVAGFGAGERVSILDLLYGAALPSGADATAMLARYVAGSEEAFVGMMNGKADELGLKNTHFANVSGLHDPDHYTTPREMAAIMLCAMDNERCRTFLSALSYTTSKTSAHPSGITLYSTAFSRMTTRRCGAAEIICAKTGYTDEARYCLASYAETDTGGRYVLITAQGSTKYTPIDDCRYVYGTFAK